MIAPVFCNQPCPSCGEMVDSYGACRCGVRGNDGPGPHPVGQPSVNADLAAFGEIVSEKALPPESAYYEPTCPECGGYFGIHSKPNCASKVPTKEDYVRWLEKQFRQAHAACDSSWRRTASSDDHAYTLAERIGGMRQMIDNYERWLAEAQAHRTPPEPDREPVNPGYLLILGGLLAWGFFSLQ